MSKFHQLEVVGRCSETQLQVGKTCNLSAPVLTLASLVDPTL